MRELWKEVWEALKELGKELRKPESVAILVVTLILVTRYWLGYSRSGRRMMVDVWGAGQPPYAKRSMTTRLVHLHGSGGVLPIGGGERRRWIPPLARHRLLFFTPNGSGGLWLYEVVPGAIIVGSEIPGTPVWIELQIETPMGEVLTWSNRRRVDELSDGRLAYIYMPNTGGAGRAAFDRDFYSQLGKEGVILDERYNRGGQVADYVIDVLSRQVMSYWMNREEWLGRSPSGIIEGPKVMIINESAGSGGDWMPWAFKDRGVGTLVGTRTWGGLVGISGYPPLMDGGSVTAANFGIMGPSRWARMPDARRTERPSSKAAATMARPRRLDSCSFSGTSVSALMALQLERSREFGVLRASGMTTGEIGTVISIETGFMGLAAGLLALPVGVGMAAFLIFVIQRRAFGWTVPFQIEPGILLQSVLLALLAALLAGVYPILRMATTSPADALRSE